MKKNNKARAAEVYTKLEGYIQGKDVLGPDITDEELSAAVHKFTRHFNSTACAEYRQYDPNWFPTRYTIHVVRNSRGYVRAIKLETPNSIIPDRFDFKMGEYAI